MDGRKNNKGVVGHRGSGGRPSLIDEKIRADLINKSWDRLLKKMNSDKVSDREKDFIAIEVMKRSVPQKIDHSNNGGSFDNYSEEQIHAIIERHYQSRGAKG